METTEANQVVTVWCPATNSFSPATIYSVGTSGQILVTNQKGAQCRILPDQLRRKAPKR
jgi:hypothetical protein